MTTFVAIDFETANQSRDSACSVALIRVEKGKIIDRFYSLIKPPCCNFIFTYIHGITDGDVRDAPEFCMLWPDMKGFIKGAEFLAAHNASFDRSVLNSCCCTSGIRALDLEFKCTMQIARQVWSIYPTKLPDVCAYLDIPLNHHHALSDAEACAKIMLKALKQI